MSDAAAILLGRDPHGVATITLNRPERGNAYDDRMLEALNDALARAAADPAVRALLLRGAGQHFQAGPDIDWLARSGLLETGMTERGGSQPLTAALNQAMHRLNQFPHPSIVVVHGACYGGGCGLASCADVVLAAPDAIFGLTDIRAGAFPPPISSHVINAIGGRNARRLATTGERFGAAEAQRIGLVHELVETARLETRLAELLDAMLHTPPGRPRVARPGGPRRRDPGAAGADPNFRERRRPGWYLAPDPGES